MHISVDARPSSIAFSEAPIEACIFDFGGVIAHPPERAHFAAMAQALDASYDDFIRVYFAERNCYDRGVISAREYWLRVYSQLKPEAASFTDSLFEQLRQGDNAAWFNLNDDMIALLRALRPRVKSLVLLSNISFEARDFLLDSRRIHKGFDWLSLFDEHIFSCDYLITKPESAIFELATKKAGRPAQHCFFTDDSADNVRGALAAGLRAELFTDSQSCRRSLDLHNLFDGGQNLFKV